MPQSAAAPDTEEVIGSRRSPPSEAQAETTYGAFALAMMRKWGAFDEETQFYDPKRQLVKEYERGYICTADELKTMDNAEPSKKKGTRAEGPPVDYSQWTCNTCCASYDGGDGWSKSRSRCWYCPTCTKGSTHHHEA